MLARTIKQSMFSPFGWSKPDISDDNYTKYCVYFGETKMAQLKTTFFETKIMRYSCFSLD